MLFEYTAEELAIEYLMYAIKKDPQEALPKLGEGRLKVVTGDDWVDSLEEKQERGDELSLEDFIDPSEVADVKKRLKGTELEEFDDKY